MGAEPENGPLDAEDAFFDFDYYDQMFERRATRRTFFREVAEAMFVVSTLSLSVFALFSFVNWGMRQ